MAPLKVNLIPQALRYCNMMMSQSRFMQTFVEDLLDLKMMRDGVFSLQKEPFMPSEVFQLVKNVFEPQAKAKQVEIKVSTHD